MIGTKKRLGDKDLQYWIIIVHWQYNCNEKENNCEFDQKYRVSLIFL